MRADRLLSILLLLQNRGRMTAQELARQLEVSERTIYRDMEALGIAGIPVYAERGPGGGCSLMDGYQTRLTGLTESEIHALFLANMTRPLDDLGLGKTLDDALLKLTASLPASQRYKAEQVRQRIHLDVPLTERPEEMMQHLQTIQQAVWQDRKLLLYFLDDTCTCVEPYGLVSRANSWYLVGAASGCKEQPVQVFRLSNLTSVTLTLEEFVRPDCFDLPRYWAEYSKQLQAAHSFKPSINRTQNSQQKKAAPASRRLQQKKAISFTAPHMRYKKKGNGHFFQGSASKKTNYMAQEPGQRTLLKKQNLKSPKKKNVYIPPFLLHKCA